MSISSTPLAGPQVLHELANDPELWARRNPYVQLTWHDAVVRECVLSNPTFNNESGSIGFYADSAKFKTDGKKELQADAVTICLGEEPLMRVYFGEQTVVGSIGAVWDYPWVSRVPLRLRFLLPKKFLATHEVETKSTLTIVMPQPPRPLFRIFRSVGDSADLKMEVAS